MDISHIPHILSPHKHGGSITQQTVSPSDGFSGLVSQAISTTSSHLKVAESAASSAMVNDISLEELASAVNQAEMTLRTIVAVRDKLIAAYQDVIKMPI